MKTMSIPDFVRNGWQEESVVQRFLSHLDRNKIKYRVVGTVIILFLGFTGTSFAAGSGIDVGAEKIYRKLVNVGKWVIIAKGGIETIKSASEGDFQASKKNFLGYGLTYGMLFALPWVLKEIEKLFIEMGS